VLLSCTLIWNNHDIVTDKAAFQIPAISLPVKKTYMHNLNIEHTWMDTDRRPIIRSVIPTQVPVSQPQILHKIFTEDLWELNV